MGNCNNGTRSEETDLDMINYSEEKRHLYVICVAFNPARSRSSIKHYLNFKRQMEKMEVKLITIECVYENSPFTLTRQNYEPHNIQISTQSSFFQKEKLINVAMTKLPVDAKYVVWCDYEVEFLNSNWVNDTIKALNVFKAAQLFDEVTFVDSNGHDQKKEKGFAAHLFEKPDLDKKAFEASTNLSGFCWGFKVDALKEIGGLIDFSPIGNCEKIMAYCLAKKMDDYVPTNLNHNFKEMIKVWQKKAAITFVAGIGYIPGTIRVIKTVTKKDKGEYDRWEILQGNNFDPSNDLFSDESQLYYVDPTRLKLKQDLRLLFIDLNGENIE